MPSNSFSVVAGLILGDFAVEIGLLVPQVILLISFTALASFAQPSYELGYAIKFVRILMIILISFFRGWGFIAGVIIGLALIATNSTVPGGRGYLYPLIPFSARALGRVFFRRSLK
ncbi:MAG: spore germination protein [Christensenellales bacterium]